MESILLDEFLCWVEVHMKLPHLLAEDLALDLEKLDILRILKGRKLPSSNMVKLELIRG